MLQEFNSLLERCESDEIYDSGLFLFLEIMGVMYKPVELLGTVDACLVRIQNVTNGNTETLAADTDWVIEYTKKMRDFVKEMGV